MRRNSGKHTISLPEKNIDKNVHVCRLGKASAYWAKIRVENEIETIKR